tara:strand:+ start:781 stop:1611 length:831 start_codon:yes stop_codon:yes gene_type:complete
MVSRSQCSSINAGSERQITNKGSKIETSNEQGQSSADTKLSFSAGRIVLLVLLTIGLAAFFAFGLEKFVSLNALKEYRETLQGWVANHEVVTALAFAAIYALAVAFSLPGAVFITIAGGFMFGPYLGTMYVVVGATIGAIAVFLAAKYALGETLRAKTGSAMKHMEAGFRENEMSYLLILRLVPLFPFWLVNLVPAFLGVSLRTYTIATLLGIIPAAFVYSLLGDGAGAVLDTGGDLDLRIIFEPRFLAPIIGLAALACIPIVYKRIKAGKDGAAN